MKRRRDTLLKGDLKVWAQEYPDRKSAAKAARLASHVIHSGEVHVRRNKVVVKTTFSADAWSMTFVTLFTMLSKQNIEPPSLVWQYANQCAKFSRKHKTWFVKTTDGKRVNCIEFMDMWASVIPMHEVIK